MTAYVTIVIQVIAALAVSAGAAYGFGRAANQVGLKVFNRKVKELQLDLDTLVPGSTPEVRVLTALEMAVEERRASRAMRRQRDWYIRRLREAEARLALCEKERTC